MDRRNMMVMLAGAALAPSRFVMPARKSMPVVYGIDHAAVGGEVTTYTHYIVCDQATEMFVPIDTVQKMWLGEELIYDRDNPTSAQLKARQEISTKVRKWTSPKRRRLL